MKLVNWKQSFVAGVALACTLSALLSPSTPAHIDFLSVELPIQEKREPAWEVDLDVFQNRLASAYGLDLVTAKKFAGWILSAAADDGIDPELIASIIATESTFRIEAVSSTGAIGPAQIQPNYWSEFCDDLNLDVPSENISCGSRILTFLIANSESESAAIKSYHAGMEHSSDEYIAPATVYYDKIVQNREQMGYAL